jgi:MEDS: MEthanogen/methylotroph, DcmR Sensory domain
MSAAIRADVVANQETAGSCGGHWSHGVFLHDTEDQLLRALEDYLLGAWAAGGVGLVVATPEHRRGLRDRLAGLGLGAAVGQGRLVELDAVATLEQFMVAGSPDPEMFERTVGSLVREHAGGARLYGFGEMVDVLWADGNAPGALTLERLWTGLQDQLSFSLLCAYDTDHLDAGDRALVASVHDQVIG